MITFVLCIINILFDINIVYAADATSSIPMVPLTPVAEMASLVTEFGIQIIIVAIMLIFMWRHMNNIIKRDNKLFEDMAPKIVDIKQAIIDMDTNITSLISNHNTHANTELKSVERNQGEMRIVLLRDEDMLKNILAQLVVLNGNIELLYRYLLNTIPGNNQPQYNIPPAFSVPKLDINSEIAKSEEPVNDEA